MATAYFLELVVAMTDAQRDQEHPEIIVMNIPSIPDRTAYILGKSSENPVIPMVTLGKQMKELGVTRWMMSLSTGSLLLRNSTFIWK
jgi:aspartate racemase